MSEKEKTFELVNELKNLFINYYNSIFSSKKNDIYSK